MTIWVAQIRSRLATVRTWPIDNAQEAAPLQEQINSIAKLRGASWTDRASSPTRQKQRPCRTSRRSANLCVSNCGHSRVMGY